MTLRFYDTASAEVRDFVPLVPGKVSLYYCGATVQGMPHVGHIRSAIAFDQLTRWLQYRGFRVTVVRNVTDIDDKILAKSADSFGPDFEDEPGAVRERGMVGAGLPLRAGIPQGLRHPGRLPPHL